MPNWSKSKTYLGFALLLAVAGLTIGGIISAFTGAQISDSAITAVTALVSTIVGGLIGNEMAKVTYNGGNADDEYEE